jgi:hypothetical protein
MIIIKSVTMTLGELNYDQMYVTNRDEQHFPIVGLVFLLLFALIMAILLMNLLVGLAIGDLMQIQQDARLKRSAMQVRHCNRGWASSDRSPSSRFSITRIWRRKSRRN